jgi:hypothetical protein
MKEALTLRSLQTIGKYTRRLHGRRAITPMKSKGKKVAIKKTRSSHKVEANVQLPKHTSSRNGSQRSSSTENQHSIDQERKGNKDSGSEGKREDTKEHQEVITEGDKSNQECTIHPGSLQELRDLSELAFHDEEHKTEHQEEQVLCD